MSEEKKKEFIEKSELKFGKGRYDYSKVVINCMVDKVSITCLICGLIFHQYAHRHYKDGYGCKKCNRHNNEHLTKLRRQEQFIERSEKRHGKGRYNYNKVVYKAANENVIIICNICEWEFSQLPLHHVRGRGCKKCKHKKIGQISSLTLDEVKNKIIHLHGDVWNFEKSVYEGRKKNIIVICKKCNMENNRRVNSLLVKNSGCTHCCSASRGEKNSEKVLIELGAEILPYKVLKSLPSRRYDIIFKYNGELYILEYDGGQHFKFVKYFKSNLEESHKIDILKTKAAIDEGYKVIRISYKDDIKLMLTEMLNDKIEWNLYVSSEKMYDWLLDNIE